MFRIKLMTIKLINLILQLLVSLVLIVLSSQVELAYGLNTNWVELQKTAAGSQYWDRNSLTNQNNGVIEITTKYLELDPNTSKELNENTYVMRINCQTIKYKDISINGKEIQRAKWEGPNGDKLINEVISDSCKNA